MAREYVELTDHQRSLLAARVARLDRLRRDLQAEQEAIREMLTLLRGPEAGWDRERQELYVDPRIRSQGEGVEPDGGAS